MNFLIPIPIVALGFFPSMEFEVPVETGIDLHRSFATECSNLVDENFRSYPSQQVLSLYCVCMSEMYINQADAFYKGI